MGDKELIVVPRHRAGVGPTFGAAKPFCMVETLLGESAFRDTSLVKLIPLLHMST